MPGETPMIEIPQPFVTKQPHLYAYEPTYKFDPNIEAEFFAYVFPTMGPFTVGATLQANVQIQANTAFEVRELAYHWSLASAAFTESTRPIPNVVIQLQDSGSGKNLFNSPMPLDSIANYGFGRGPMKMWPRIFAPNSNITAIVTNFDAAAATGSLRLSMIGRHLYKLAR